MQSSHRHIHEENVLNVGGLLPVSFFISFSFFVDSHLCYLVQWNLAIL